MRYIRPVKAPLMLFVSWGFLVVFIVPSQIRLELKKAVQLDCLQLCTSICTSKSEILIETYSEKHKGIAFRNAYLC